MRIHTGVAKQATTATQAAYARSFRPASCFKIRRIAFGAGCSYLERTLNEPVSL